MAARPGLLDLTQERPWSLGAYLALGLLLRAVAVLCADGYACVDQQYQGLDPAWHLATGDDWHRTWEWDSGMRSWVYPGILAAIFRLGLALGITDPDALMLLQRALHALASLLPLALCWLLLTRWRPLPQPRLALLVFAFAGAGVHASVQPAGANFAAVLSVAAVLAALGPGRWPLLGGALLGLAFCCRFQDALFGPLIVGTLLFTRAHRKAVWFALGTLPLIALQGLVDLATWGSFLHSPFAYVQQNVILGAAAKWGTEPWWYYLLLLVLPMLVLVPPFVRPALAALRRGAGHAALPLVAALGYLLLHSLIGRKAARFVWPALWLLTLTLAMGLRVGDAAEPWTVRWHRRLFLLGQGGLWLWASCWAANSGPVDAARWLGAQPTMQGELLAVDCDATAVGGFANLQQGELCVRQVARDGLVAVLAALPAGSRRWLIAGRRPLGLGALSELGSVQVRSFGDPLDLRQGARRFVYLFQRS